MNEKQELHCHNCKNYVRFNLDLSIDGNYKLKCPECGHLHYRIVKNGIISDLRWGRDPSQDNWINITVTSVSTAILIMIQSHHVPNHGQIQYIQHFKCGSLF